mgnify:CR=1 FL=1
MTAALLVALVLALLLLRQPLVVILLAVAAYVQLAWGRGQLDYILEDMWVALDKELILSIPLFILCGNVMTMGSTAKRLIRIMAAVTQVLPGGLGIAAVLSCGIFAAISGSSIVTMLAIGTVMYPAMRAAQYDNKYALGTIMSGGTLGIVIPPSIPMIIYGLVTETSVTELFAAGFGPGISGGGDECENRVKSIGADIGEQRAGTQPFEDRIEARRQTELHREGAILRYGRPESKPVDQRPGPRPTGPTGRMVRYAPSGLLNRSTETSGDTTSAWTACRQSRHVPCAFLQRIGLTRPPDLCVN